MSSNPHTGAILKFEDTTFEDNEVYDVSILYKHRFKIAFFILINAIYLATQVIPYVP